LFVCLLGGWLVGCFLFLIIWKLVSRWNLPIHPPKSHSWKECLCPPHFSLAATDWLCGGLIRDYKQKSDEEEEEEANSTGLYHLQPQLPEFCWWWIIMSCSCCCCFFFFFFSLLMEI
jgi:hypothetical protein